jgi:hypothetical protein
MAFFYDFFWRNGIEPEKGIGLYELAATQTHGTV